MQIYSNINITLFLTADIVNIVFVYYGNAGEKPENINLVIFVQYFDKNH